MRSFFTAYDINYLPGQHNCQQGPHDAAEGYIAQRQAQHYDVADKIEAAELHAGELVYAHSQRIVSTGGGANTDTQTNTHTDEQRAQHSRRKWHISNAGIYGRPDFKHAIYYGKTDTPFAKFLINGNMKGEIVLGM